jgi:hypothetical protein
MMVITNVTVIDGTGAAPRDKMMRDFADAARQAGLRECAGVAHQTF